jgi:hypothetical protein
MRKDKRELLATLAGLVVVAGAGVFALWALMPRLPSRDRLDPAAYSRIRAGMTEAEVRAAVGHPPGDLYASEAIGGKQAISGLEGWGRRPEHRLRVTDPAPNPNDGLMRQVWFGRFYILEVIFDSDRKVVGCYLSSFSPRGRPIIEVE